MRPVILQSERLFLSVPTVADEARIIGYATDPTSREWMPLPDPYGPEQFAFFLEQVVGAGWREDTEYTFAIRERAAGPDDPAAAPLLGCVGLGGPKATVKQVGEIGWVVHPDARGRGLAAEAAGMVVDWALRSAADGGLGMRRAIWFAGVGNEASRRVAEKVGFRVEGTLRSEVRLVEGYVDGWVGTVLPGDRGV